jgi:Uma2 family endonuclease
MVEIAALEKRMTAEEYLERERKTLREIGGKHEFFNQQLIEMAGASTAHNTIVPNLTFIVKSQIKANKSNHIVLSADEKVVSYQKGKNYFYPDLIIVEDRSYHDDEHDDILLNPAILFEVLSDSTALFDRGDKFRSYRQINSLKEYILIAQDEKRIEHFFKDDNGRWQIGEVVTEGSLVLTTAPFELTIEEAYDGVIFK